MAALRWDQTPEFLAASNTTLVPGGPTAYTIPRPTGFCPQDVTDFHPGQADWSLDNLPSIIYTLNSPRARNAWKTVTKRPGEKRDQAGHIVYERWPKAGTVARPLLDFSVLPDRIGTKESWWVMEAWRRLDPRIAWLDIVMRMERFSTTDKRAANNLNMAATRVRSKFGLITWHSRGIGKKMTELRDAVLNRLSPTQIANNTTRGLTPGLVNPVLGEAGGRVPLPGEDDHGTEDQGSEEEQGNDEEQENVQGHEIKGEHSPAPTEIAQGPPRGIFYLPRVPDNGIKRKHNDAPEQTDNPDHNRKKTRTIAPPAYDTLPDTSSRGDYSRTISRTRARSARHEILEIPRTQPVQHYDAHVVQDFARYRIDLLKRKHDDSEAIADPRKRARRAMADELEGIPTPPKATTSSIWQMGLQDENAEFSSRLDPALFAAPANQVANEQKQAAGQYITDLRPKIQPHRKQLARPTTPRHVLRRTAQGPADTSHQAVVLPRAHLPGARAQNTPETRLQDLLEASTAREAAQAHLPRARAATTAEPRSLGQARRAGVLAQLLGTSDQDTTVLQSPGPSGAIMGSEIPRAHLPGARA